VLRSRSASGRTSCSSVSTNLLRPTSPWRNPNNSCPGE
jgi:hypothetical protein